MPFLGTHLRKIDDKWRLPLPHDLLYRECSAEGTTYLLSAEPDHLILFSETTFNQVLEGFLGKNILEHKELRTDFLSETYPKALDKAGRIVIPEALRGVEGFAPATEVKIKGTGPYAEIWPVSRTEPEAGRQGVAALIDSLATAMRG
jgi:DNA-binding transcriptional regulator/RsmH inhibitor MraZ